MMQHRFAKVPARRTPAVSVYSAVVRSSQVSAVILAVVIIMFGIRNPAMAQTGGDYEVAQGVGVYLGVLPAEIVRGYPAYRPEATMHGGVPSGPHEHHIVIAVFDAATGDRIENAKVTATVSGLGHVGQSTLSLDPMTIAGTVTYGGFVNFPGNDTYDIAVDIELPGRSAPVHVDFSYEHSL